VVAIVVGTAVRPVKKITREKPENSNVVFQAICQQEKIGRFSDKNEVSKSLRTKRLCSIRVRRAKKLRKKA